METVEKLAVEQAAEKVRLYYSRTGNNFEKNYAILCLVGGGIIIRYGSEEQAKYAIKDGNGYRFVVYSTHTRQF